MDMIKRSGRTAARVIAASSWTRRGWAVHDAAVATYVDFQFADGVVAVEGILGLPVSRPVDAGPATLGDQIVRFYGDMKRADFRALDRPGRNGYAAAVSGEATAAAG